MKYLKLITEPKLPNEIKYIDLEGMNVDQSFLTEQLKKINPIFFDSSEKLSELESVKQIIRDKYPCRGTDNLLESQMVLPCKIIGVKSDDGLYGVFF